MKIHYREPTVVEQMNNAINVSSEVNRKPIDYFELSREELNSHYTNFDKIGQAEVTYSYKGILIKVKE